MSKKNPWKKNHSLSYNQLSSSRGRESGTSELYDARDIFVFLFSLTLGGSNISELNQAVADGLPIVDIKAWAYDAELTLPANQTTLQVTAFQANEGLNPLTYRGVKVSGPPLGEVTFMFNGNEDPNITTATFRDNAAGIYTLRVMVSHGLMRESISEVEGSINPERSDARSGDAKVRVERLGKRMVMTTVDRVIMRFDIIQMIWKARSE